MQLSKFVIALHIAPPPIYCQNFSGTFDGVILVIYLQVVSELFLK